MIRLFNLLLLSCLSAAAADAYWHAPTTNNLIAIKVVGVKTNWSALLGGFTSLNGGGAGPFVLVPTNGVTIDFADAFPSTISTQAWARLGMPASQITSGVFPWQRLGSGGGGATKFLREDSTFQSVGGSVSPSDLSVGTGISITSGTGIGVTLENVTIGVDMAADYLWTEYHEFTKWLRYKPTAVTSVIFDTVVSGFGQTHFYGLGDGTIIWSDGTSTPDASLRRSAAGILTVTNRVNAITGFRIGNAATSGNYLRGNGTDFVSSAIQAGDLPNITSGTYTPTLSNVANLDGSTAFTCQYSRVGSVVTVSGKVSVNPTLTVTSTQLGISLPIASALSAQEQVGGTAYASAIAAQGAAIRADATNDRAEMVWMATDTTDQPMFFSYTYSIQ